MSKILILSPHFDDALLSCGSFILNRIKKGDSVVLLNIFTHFESDFCIPLIQKQLETLHLSPQQFQNRRQHEDLLAWKNLPMKRINLHFTDGAFRCVNGKMIYTNSQQLFSGKIPASDSQLILNLTTVFLRLKALKFSFVVTPLAIGMHADHVITKKAAEAVWTKSDLVYYADQPYFQKGEPLSLYDKLSLTKRSKIVFHPTKEKVIRLLAYSTQLPFLFVKKEDLLITETLFFDTTKKLFSKNTYF